MNPLLRSRLPSLGRLAAGAAAACLVLTAPLRAQTLSFDSAGDVSSLTQIATSGTSSISSLSYSAAAGTGGSGGLVNASNDVTAFYNAASFNLTTGAGYTFSLDFHKTANNNSSIFTMLQLGLFASNNSGASNSNQYVTFQLYGPSQTGTANTFQLALNNRDNAVPAATNLGSAFTLADSNADWYRWVGSITLTNAATHTYSYTFSFLDLGTSGTAAPATLASYSGTFVNATLAADSSLWLGLRDPSTVMTAVDNLSIAPVPEPAVAWLVLPALAVFAAARRRLARS